MRSILGEDVLTEMPTGSGKTLILISEAESDHEDQGGPNSTRHEHNCEALSLEQCNTNSNPSLNCLILVPA